MRLEGLINPAGRSGIAGLLLLSSVLVQIGLLSDFLRNSTISSFKLKYILKISYYIFF